MNVALHPLKARWAALAPREQLGLQVAGLALLLLLVISVFVLPPLKTLREAPQRLQRLDAELALMQAWAGEARQLVAQAPVSPAQAQAALQEATEALGGDARLSVQGDRATLTFSGLSGDLLAAWLTETRNTARVRAVEAQWQRGPTGYGGSIVVLISP